jgi:dihydrofolate reductase
VTDLCVIAALDRRGAIGRGNALPWHLPDDLKRFKALTLGKPVLMGRRTAESLGRALPGRRNLVLSRADAVPFAGMERVASLDAALAAVADAGELWVIGGGEIYTLCLPQATRLHLTHVDTEVAGADAFFPPWSPHEWRVLNDEAHAADARHAFAFRFTDYIRAGQER